MHYKLHLYYLIHMFRLEEWQMLVTLNVFFGISVQSKHDCNLS